MKKNMILIISAICLLSCNSVNNGPQVPLTSQWGSFELVKFSDPTYIQYVFTDIAFDSQPYKLRVSQNCCMELFLGKNPYIELTDGYYIVDWKWGQVIYPTYNSFFLNYRWEDVKSVYQVWDRSTEIISNIDAITSLGYYRRQDIDKFLGIELSKDTSLLPLENYVGSKNYVRPWWVSERLAEQWKYLDDIPDTIYQAHYEYLPDRSDSVFFPAYTKVDYLKEVAFQDSLQMQYAEKLIKIIKAGNLEKAVLIQDSW